MSAIPSPHPIFEEAARSAFGNSPSKYCPGVLFYEGGCVCATNGVVAVRLKLKEHQPDTPGAPPVSQLPDWGVERLDAVTLTDLGPERPMDTCDECNGTGRWGSEPCELCEGSGKLKPLSVSVNLPGTLIGISDRYWRMLFRHGAVMRPTNKRRQNGDLYGVRFEIPGTEIEGLVMPMLGGISVEDYRAGKGGGRTVIVDRDVRA